MLDPRDAKIDSAHVHGMLKGLSGRVWRFLKHLIGEALGGSMEYPQRSTRKSRGAHVQRQRQPVLLLAFIKVFVPAIPNIRESTVHEYIMFSRRMGRTHYRLVRV